MTVFSSVTICVINMKAKQNLLLLSYSYHCPHPQIPWKLESISGKQRIQIIWQISYTATRLCCDKGEKVLDIGFDFLGSHSLMLWPDFKLAVSSFMKWMDTISGFWWGPGRRRSESSQHITSAQSTVVMCGVSSACSRASSCFIFKAQPVQIPPFLWSLQ